MSIHPSLISWMPTPAIDEQSLRKGHRSAGKHLKVSTKESEPL